MELIASPRVDFLRALTAEIAHNYSRGRVFVAVDGILGSGTSEFADGLAATFREAGHDTFRASIDDFQNPRSQRERQGADSARGFYDDTYDYVTFRRVLVDPFRMGGSAGFQTSAFDVRRDAPRESRWLSAGGDAICIVDGPLLNRSELRGIWNYSIYLETPWRVAYARLAEHGDVDADPEAPSNARTRRGQDLYLAEAFPRGAAGAIVDNTDPEHPTRVFADSC